MAFQIGTCLLSSEVVGGLGYPLELRFALKIQEDGGFLDVAAFEDFFDDVVSVEGLAGFFQDIGDVVGDGSLFVAPFFQGVDTAAD